MNEAIHKIEEILSSFNPLEIIAQISKHIATSNLQEHAESEDMLWYPLIEYLMSLALTKPMPTSPKKIENSTIDAILKLWTQLKTNFSLYYISESVDKKGDKEAEIRFKLILDYFSLRGKSYPPILEKTFLELFEPHEEHLINTLGFSAKDFNDFIGYSKSAITSSINEEFEALQSLEKLHSRFSKWIKGQNVQGETPDNTMKRFIGTDPTLKSLQAKANHLSKIRAYDGLEIQPQNKLHEKILNYISCSFGDNKAFLEPKKMRAWPTNDTIVSECPVISVEDEHYLFSYATLAWNRIAILENLLQKSSPDYYQDRYRPTRDRYVEKTTISLLRTLLPDAFIDDTLYYYIEEDGIRKRVELDGLVLYDDCLLLIEAKAGMLPVPARRGAMKGLKGKVKEILKKGHSQAIRALDYIMSSQKVDFVDEDDNVKVTIEGEELSDKIRKIYDFELLFG
ncbi:MAG: hypothetical protein P1Q69_17415 [Candidatus Thorarchaeota archaeon]|nr:hypothetical protein [Candidatus Thorarchaeota archaeon]